MRYRRLAGSLVLWLLAPVAFSAPDYVAVPGVAASRRPLAAELRALEIATGVRPRYVLPGGSLVVRAGEARRLEISGRLAAHAAPGDALARDQRILARLAALEAAPIAESFDASESDTLIADDTADARSAPGEPASILGYPTLETSEYMVGTIVVGLLLYESNGVAEPSVADWTGEDVDEAVARTLAGLERYFEAWPDGPFSFVIHLESNPPAGAVPGTVACDYEAGLHGNMDGPTDLSAFQNLGVEAGTAMESRRRYVNDLRARYASDWAVVAKVIHDGPDCCGRASAFLYGPQATWFRSSGAFTIHHELGHLFGALDEYCPDACRSPVALSGYLGVPNANSQGNDGTGYFGGAGQGAQCMMINNYHAICPHTRAALGWWDSDGNGVPDVADTPPTSAIETISVEAGTIRISGSAALTPLINQGLERAAIAVGHVSLVEVRVNGLTWQPADPTDGAFDTASEEFAAGLGPLPDGQYLVEARSLSAAGRIQLVLARSLVEVVSSPVLDAPPFAVLAAPGFVPAGTPLELDATASRDLEGRALEARFDFESDGSWDTAWQQALAAEHVYPGPGSFRPLVELRDAEGNRSSASALVSVSAERLAPVAVIAASGGASFGSAAAGFELDASASRAADGGALGYRWDLDGDGLFELEGPARASALVATDSALGLVVTLEVEDETGLTARAHRYLVAVAYDAPPEARLFATPSFDGLEFVLDASSSSDPDQLATWDNYLSYRFDFDGDGSFDTGFAQESGAAHAYRADGLYEARLEVRDRYRATSSASVTIDLREPPVWSATEGLTTADSAECGIALAWGPASDATPPVRYRVYRGATADFLPGPGSLIAETAALSFLDASAAPGAEHHYIVRAVDATDAEDANRVVVAAVAPEPPLVAAVGNTLRLAKAGSLVALAWQSPHPSVTAYAVRRASGRDAASGAVLERLAAGETSFANPDPGAGLSSYRIESLGPCAE